MCKLAGEMGSDGESAGGHGKEEPYEIGANIVPTSCYLWVVVVECGFECSFGCGLVCEFLGMTFLKKSTDFECDVPGEGPHFGLTKHSSGVSL